MATMKPEKIRSIPDPVDRAAAADVAMWLVDERGQALLHVRNAAVRDALAAGRPAAEIAARLGVTEQDVTRIGAEAPAGP